MNRYGVLIAAAALVVGLTQVTPLALAHGHGGGGHGGGHYGGGHYGGGRHYHDHDRHDGGVAAAGLIGFGVGAAYANDRYNNVCPPPGESNQYSENYPGACPDASDSTLVGN